MSADFRWVATLDGEGRLTVRELATGKKHAESLLQGNKIRYAELQFGMDSKTLLARIYEPAVSSEYTQPVLTSVAVWDALTGRLLCRLAAQWEGAMLAPDGRQLLLSGRNVRKEPAMILDTRSGKALWAVPDLAFSGSRTAFSPDGQWLAFTDPQRKTLQLCEVLTGQVVRTFPSLPHRIRSVVFAPDGRSIATTGEDCALLVWDVTGLAPQAGRLRSSELDDEAREQLWSDLAATDGPPSNTAFWKLVAGGKASVAFVAARIRPVVGPDPKCVAALIAGLSSPRFETRQQASRQLAAMEAARPALVAALADNPDPEARRRLEDVLRKLDHPSSNPPMLRWLRVVAVLEQIGSAEAREVLRDLANGEPDARFTQSAGAALIRLDKGLNGGFQH